MNATDEGAALTAYLTERGFKTSRRQIAKILRDLGMKFRESDVRGGSRNHSTSGREPQIVLTGAIPEPLRNHLTASTRSAHVANGISLSSGEYQDKGLLHFVQQHVDSPLRSESEAAVPAPSAPQPVQKVLPLDRRSPAEIVADAAMERLRPLIEPELTGIPWSTKARGAAGYRERNRKHAVSMAAAGKTADDIVEAYLDACERRHVSLVLDLKWVQEDFDRQKPSFTDDAAPSSWVHLPDDDPIKLDILRRRMDREAASDTPAARIAVDQDPRRIAGWMTGVVEIKARVHGGVA